MKITEVVNDDAKKCAQLLNFLKASKADALNSSDCIAVAEGMAWFNGVVKQIAMALSTKPAVVVDAPAPSPTAVVPAIIFPEPKKKKGKN